MFFPDVHFFICCLCLMHDKSAAASFMWSQFYLISISSFLFFFFFFLSSLFLRSRLFLPASSALPFIDCIFCLLYNTYSAWNITSRGRHCAATLRLVRDFSRERERERELMQSGTRNSLSVAELMHLATAALTVVIEIPSMARKF